MNLSLSLSRRIRMMFNDYLFPKNCLNCKKEGVWLCDSCKNSLFFINRGFCPFCNKVELLFCVCNNCKNNNKIEKVFSLFFYRDPLARNLIKYFKYRKIRDILNDVIPIIRMFLYKYKGLIDISESVIVPIPLYWRKEMDRGFNQAEILADIMGSILNLPVLKDIIIKNKNTKNQAEITTELRFDNLNNVFKVQGFVPKNIILVDDVFTTGATLKEVSRVLSLGGAKKIQAITLARG